MLIIHLPENLTLPLVPLYYKNRSRLPTVTDINIISNNLIIAMHRYAGKVYLIEIDDQLTNYKILDTIQLSYGDNMFQTEMLTRKDNRLYIITFTEYMVIVDIIDNNKLQFISKIKLNTRGNLYHGLDVFNNNLYISPAIVSNNQMHIIKIDITENQNITQNKIQKIITTEFINNTSKYRIKDISFFSDGKVLMIIMINNGKTNMKMNNHVDNGFIGLYDRNFNQLDKYPLNDVHLDGLVINVITNEFYLTIEETDGGFIYKGSIDNEKNIINKDIKKIKTENFPHGIDISLEYNLFGYTAYSTSSVYLMRLDEI